MFSGANILTIDKNVVVVDNGDFDCDGDGLSDPNRIVGPGQVLADASRSDIVSEGKGGVSSGIIVLK